MCASSKPHYTLTGHRDININADTDTDHSHANGGHLPDSRTLNAPGFGPIQSSRVLMPALLRPRVSRSLLRTVPD